MKEKCFWFHYLDGAVTNSIPINIPILEKEGRIIVVEPQKEVTVSRLEKDKKKLQDLYDDGVKNMKVKLAELKSIL